MLPPCALLRAHAPSKSHVGLDRPRFAGAALTLPQFYVTRGEGETRTGSATGRPSYPNTVIAMGSPGRTWRCQLIPPAGSSLGPSSATRGFLLDKSGTRCGGKRNANLHHSGHVRITARPAHPKPTGGANMRLGTAGMLTWGNLGTFGCLISCILPDPDSLVIVSRILASHAKGHSRSGTAHATWVFIPCYPADCCPCPATSAGYQSAGPGIE